jgi:hypothetical protein
MPTRTPLERTADASILVLLPFAVRSAAYRDAGARPVRVPQSMSWSPEAVRSRMTTRNSVFGSVRGGMVPLLFSRRMKKKMKKLRTRGLFSPEVRQNRGYFLRR